MPIDCYWKDWASPDGSTAVPPQPTIPPAPLTLHTRCDCHECTQARARPPYQPWPQPAPYIRPWPPGSFPPPFRCYG